MNIVEDYDKCVLYLMFIKCYHHLHSMSKFKVKYVKQTINENYNLNISQHIVSIIKSMKDLVTIELLIFKHYQMHINENVFCSSRENMKLCFFFSICWFVKF